MGLIPGRCVQGKARGPVEISPGPRVPVCCAQVSLLRWRTTTGHHDTGAPEEKPGGAEAVTLPEEEPGEMENEICPETMSQLALTNSISPKELLTCRKRVTEWK